MLSAQNWTFHQTKPSDPYAYSEFGIFLFILPFIPAFLAAVGLTFIVFLNQKHNF